MNEAETKVNTWGGRRAGAGRPASGKKKYSFYVTEEEYIILRQKLEEIRNEAK
jgi:hypothetical protein